MKVKTNQDYLVRCQLSINKVNAALDLDASVVLPFFCSRSRNVLGRNLPTKRLIEMLVSELLYSEWSNFCYRDNEQFMLIAEKCKEWLATQSSPNYTIGLS